MNNSNFVTYTIVSKYKKDANGENVGPKGPGVLTYYCDSLIYQGVVYPFLNPIAAHSLRKVKRKCRRASALFFSFRGMSVPSRVDYIIVSPSSTLGRS